jgi:ATP-binding cassette, subfamily B, multidrug efflux pump
MSSTFTKLTAYLQPYRWHLARGVVTLFVTNLLSVYIPLLVKEGIDRLKPDFDPAQLGRIALWIVGLTTVMWGVRLYSRVAIFGLGRRVQADLKQQLFEHLLSLEPAYFVRNTIGDLINRSTSDVENIMRLLGFSTLSIVNIIFAYLFTLPAMLFLNVKLTILSLLVYPLMLVIVQAFSKKLRAYQSDVQDGLSDLSDLIQEDLSGINSIKIYAQEENERNEFQRRNQSLLQANLKLAFSRNTVFPLIQGIASISILVLLWQGGRSIAAKEVSVGDFLALIVYARNLIFPTALLGFTITSFQRGEVSIARIEEILTNQPQIADKIDAIDIAETVSGKLAARNLSFTYPDNKEPALRDLNFTIFPGETIAIVGPIGAGKSTLANLFLRLSIVPDNGLFIDDIDINNYTLEALRRSIAYVPQESFLFSATIAENIRYGAPSATHELVETAAKSAQIHWEIQNFPQQYETIVGERGITLSGGQRQRTALARALSIDSPIVILDDCLASVDNQTATAILNNLNAGTHAKTVIFITHQLSAAATADRIFVMEKGTIVQIGTHSELVDVDGGLYQQLWQRDRLASKLQ